MSTLGVWLRSREPAPPEPLAAALRGVGDSSSTERAEAAPERRHDLVDALAMVGRDRLRLALARPGRERESAYRLLEADALFTYACEAALQRGDATAALRRILAVTSG